MRYVLPRVILGNRGDLASRWGVLRAFHSLDVDDITIFCRSSEDIPSLSYPELPYGPVRNLLHNRAGWNAIQRADVVLWAVGLDLQDDSSLAKLIYLWLNFNLYRLLGKRVWVLFQGAGPLSTTVGKALTKSILRCIDLFVARDPGTFDLVGGVYPLLNRALAHDAIFLPGFEEDLVTLTGEARQRIDSLLDARGRPVIGVNIRQWFHFASSWMPYQFSQKAYIERSRAKMEQVIQALASLAGSFRRQFNARILLISSYQPGVVSWEDDLYWVQQIKRQFADDSEIIAVDQPLTMPTYFALMSRLQLMVGMRLHSSLIALRFGVPSINISYTLKGNDIFSHLGLSENVQTLGEFLQSPQGVFHRACQILGDPEAEKQRVQKSVSRAIDTNMRVLHSLVPSTGVWTGSLSSPSTMPGIGKFDESSK